MKWILIIEYEQVFLIDTKAKYKIQRRTSQKDKVLRETNKRKFKTGIQER